MPKFEEAKRENGDDQTPPQQPEQEEQDQPPTVAEQRAIQRQVRKTGSPGGNAFGLGMGPSKISYVPPEQARTTFEFVRAGDLVVDPRYNRDIKQKWVEQIAANYNPDQLQALNISRRLFRFVQRSSGTAREEQVFDGNLSASNRIEMVVISGQHRLLATLRAKGPDFMLPCVVYDKLTESQEAELFALFDEQVRPHQPWQRHKAHVFGGNPEALDIEKIVTDAGLKVYKGDTAGGRDGVIYAVSTLYSIYRLSGRDMLNRILNIHFSAWTDNQEGYTAPMLQGTALLIRRFGGYYGWRDEYLAIALADPAHNPLSTRQRAQGAASGISATSIAQEVARIMHRYYQQGKKGYARLPEWNASPREITLASDAAKARATPPRARKGEANGGK